MTATTRPFFAERKRIVELAVKYKFPAIYPEKGFVDEGGLMSYGADFDELYRYAAMYVDKILKGAQPADLPVQQPTKGRVRDLSESGKADRPDDPAECVGAGG